MNSLSILNLIDCLSPFCLVLFLGFCSVLSFGPYFFVSSIWQPPCVCFCVLGRAALTPCLSSMACYRKGTCKLYGVEPGWGSLLHCFVALCGGRAQRGDSATLWLLEVCPALTPHFQSLHPLPANDWCPSSCLSGVESQTGWVSICFKTIWAL